MEEFMVEYRKVDWECGRLEDINFQDYYFRLSGTRAADQDKNCPARCWLRSKFPEESMRMGI